MDISDFSSIQKCAETFKKKVGQIDILINNAGTIGKINELTTNYELTSDIFDSVFNTNFFGTINMTELFLQKELIRKNGKIIIITSSDGNAMRVGDKKLRGQITADDLTLQKIYSLADQYKNAIINHTVKKESWITDMGPVYSNSKLLLNAYAKSLKNREEISNKNIQVYACCPGWVRTDMGGIYAPRSIEGGSITPVYLVELPREINDNYQGKFFSDKKVFDWENTPMQGYTP